MTRLTPEQLTDLNRLAGAALEQMKLVARRDPAGDLRRGVHLMRELTGLHGRSGIAHVVRSWCDVAIDATPGAERGRPTHVVFASPDGHHLVDRQYILPERQWASDVLAARFADDHVQLYRLIEQLPDDGDRAVFLFRLVEMIAALLVSYETPDPADGPLTPGLYRGGLPDMADQ